MDHVTTYAVSRGCYSDYVVLCVCEDRETAQRFCDAYNSDGGRYSDTADTAEIEEMPFYCAGSAPERVVTFRSETVLCDDGTVGATGFWDYAGWGFDRGDDLPPKRPKVVYCRAPILKNRAGYLRVHGRTAEGVAKATNDRIAAFRGKSWIPQGKKASAPK